MKYGEVVVHHDEVAEASGHDEDVEEFVASEVFVAVVEDWELHGIDDSSYGIDDASD